MVMLDQSAALPRPASGARPPARLLGLALLAAAVRCVLRYVVLPFGLPMVGLAPGVALGVGLACDALAVVATVTAVRRLWAARHPARWRYLLLVGGLLLAVGALRLGESPL
jgi:hypothetical protein